MSYDIADYKKDGKLVKRTGRACTTRQQPLLEEVPCTSAFATGLAKNDTVDQASRFLEASSSVHGWENLRAETTSIPRSEYIGKSINTRRQITTPEDLEKRRQDRKRDRNRLAAAKYRKKKDDRISQLESQLQEERERIEILEDELDTLDSMMDEFCELTIQIHSEKTKSHYLDTQLKDMNCSMYHLKLIETAVKSKLALNSKVDRMGPSTSPSIPNVTDALSQFPSLELTDTDFA